MSDTGSLETEPLAQAGRPARSSPITAHVPERAAASVKPAATFMIVCLLLARAAVAVAQQPLVAPAPPAPEFFTRFDFHLTAAWLGDSPPTITAPAVPAVVAQRGGARGGASLSFDTHWGGSLTSSTTCSAVHRSSSITKR
jgi:hypothetical protein